MHATGRAPFVATACNIRAGFGRKSLTSDKREPLNIEYHSHPDTRFAYQDPHCEPYYLQPTEDSSSVFGKVVSLRDGKWGICMMSPLQDRVFTLGWGTRTDCGSVLYEGTISTPSTASTSGPLQLGGLETSHLTLEDHRARSARCERVEAPLILRENAQSAEGVTVSRRRYAGKATPVPPAPALEPRQDPLPVCAFFDKPDQAADREPAPCEVGTYFLEDDGPYGKLVQLEDWTEGTCDTPHGVPIGRRLYPLGAGKVDACGTITYGEPGEGQTWSLFGGLVFGVEMRDHRFRKRSALCPPSPALIDVLEKVYRGSVRDTPILERHFYAPLQPVTPPARDRTISHGSP